MTDNPNPPNGNVTLLKKYQERLATLQAERDQFAVSANARLMEFEAQRRQMISNIETQSGDYNGRIAELKAIIQDLTPEPPKE